MTPLFFLLLERAQALASVIINRAREMTWLPNLTMPNPWLRETSQSEMWLIQVASGLTVGKTSSGHKRVWLRKMGVARQKFSARKRADNKNYLFQIPGSIPGLFI